MLEAISKIWSARRRESSFLKCMAADKSVSLRTVATFLLCAMVAGPSVAKEPPKPSIVVGEADSLCIALFKSLSGTVIRLDQPSSALSALLNKRIGKSAEKTKFLIPEEFSSDALPFAWSFDHQSDANKSAVSPWSTLNYYKISSDHAIMSLSLIKWESKGYGYSQKVFFGSASLLLRGEHSRADIDAAAKTNDFSKFLHVRDGEVFLNSSISVPLDRDKIAPFSGVNWRLIKDIFFENEENVFGVALVLTDHDHTNLALVYSNFGIAENASPRCVLLGGMFRVKR